MKKVIIILAIYSILVSAYAIVSEFFRVGHEIKITLIVPFIHLATLLPVIIFGFIIIAHLKKNKLWMLNPKKNIQLHECPECHLDYKEKEWMNKCEVWCKEHHSCNLEITAHATENEKKNL